MVVVRAIMATQPFGGYISDFHFDAAFVLLEALYGTRNGVSLCLFLFSLLDSGVYGDSRV